MCRVEAKTLCSETLERILSETAILFQVFASLPTLSAEIDVGRDPISVPLNMDAEGVWDCSIGSAWGACGGELSVA